MRQTHYYKYRSLANLRYFLDILIYKRLYLASYSELNDPMEGAFRIPNGVYNDSWLRLLRSEKNDIHICSFSKAYDNMLMWSHYADSHKGCCIEVEVTSEKGITEVPVSYVDQIGIGVGKDYKEEAYQILSRKLKCWDYEKEVRFMKEIPSLSRLSKYLKVKIVRIYLGCKIPSKDVAFYKNLILSIDKNIKVEQIKKLDLSY